jgi:hypothetical protein
MEIARMRRQVHVAPAAVHALLPPLPPPPPLPPMIHFGPQVNAAPHIDLAAEYFERMRQDNFNLAMPVQAVEPDPPVHHLRRRRR